MTKLRLLSLFVCIALCGYFWYQSVQPKASIISASEPITITSIPIDEPELLAQLYTHDRAAKSELNLLRNGSFEGIPSHSTVPEAWLDWGPLSESAPDIHPTGTFGVTKKEKDGDTYLGMVVRDNETWEKVAQRLDKPLKKGKTYKLTGYIARSETYISVSKLTEERANYNTAAILKINGANNLEDTFQLLGKTPPIYNAGWRYFEVTLEPKSDAPFLVLEAYYDENFKQAYNGNILIDGLELTEL